MTTTLSRIVREDLMHNETYLTVGSTLIIGPVWTNPVGTRDFRVIYCEGIRYVVHKDDLENNTEPIV